jgi:hypothetical protein
MTHILHFILFRCKHFLATHTVSLKTMTKVRYQRVNMHGWLNRPIAKVKCIYRAREGEGEGEREREREC